MGSHKLFPNAPKTFQFPPRLPNYENPPTRAPLIISSSIIFPIISLIFVVIRLWARARLSKKVYLEDHLTVLAWVMSAFGSASCIYSIRYGVGLHWYDLSPEVRSRPRDFPSIYVHGMMYWMSVMVIKVTFLLLYLRLTPSLWFQRAVKASLVFVLVSSLGPGLVSMFPCRPIRASFDNNVPADTCVDFNIVLKTMAGFHLAHDALIMVLPIPILWRSRMNRKKKAHVISVFLLGGLVTIVSAVRVAMVIEVQKPENIADYNWAAAILMALSSVEINVGIICSCLPATRMAFGKWMPRWFADTSSEGSDKDAEIEKGSGSKESGSISRERGGEGSGKWRKTASQSTLRKGTDVEGSVGSRESFDVDTLRALGDRNYYG